MLCLSLHRVLTQLSVELNNRAAFIDFCKGLLDLNPVTRWTPQQARGHPFITGEKYKGPYVVRCIQIRALEKHD